MRHTPTVVSVYDQSKDISSLKSLLKTNGYDVITPSIAEVEAFCLSNSNIATVIIDYPKAIAHELIIKVQAILPEVTIIWFSDDVKDDGVVSLKDFTFIALKKPLNSDSLFKVLEYCVKSSNRHRQLTIVNLQSVELQRKLASYPHNISRSST